MNAARMLLYVAMFGYPADFRKHYSAQMIDDFEASRTNPLIAALDIVKNGAAMRAENILNDVAYGLRRLRRAPLFVTIVILTFALGIGTNVAVFSILNAVLLKPLPYRNADRLVVFRIANAHQGAIAADLSVAEVADFHAQSKTLEYISATTPDNATLTGFTKPQKINGADVMPDFFRALGVAPELGRFFNDADERPGTHSVIISDRMWRKYFNASSSAIGKPFVLDGTSYSVVGVAPRQFKLPAPDMGRLIDMDYAVPQPVVAAPTQRGAQYLGTLGLLKPGTSLQSANAELQIISKRLAQKYPGFEGGSKYYVQPLTAVVEGPSSRAIWTVFFAVLGILLITCANVSNMVLATASSRDREFALRAALGASRGRLASQLLIETGVLATMGAVAGVVLAALSLNALRSALAGFPRADTITLDAPVLLYALAVLIVATVLSGFWPIRAISRSDLQLLLKSAGRGGDATSSNRVRATMVVVEVSIALALVVVSGLMVRSFYLLTHADTGVRTDRVFASDMIGLPASRYGTLAQRAQFHRLLMERVNAIPGIQSAALTVNFPLSDTRINFEIGIAGRHFPPNAAPVLAMSAVTPAYFETMGIPLLRGRAFSSRDTETSLPVAVVNRTFERLYAPSAGAIGMRIDAPGFNGTKHGYRTIVGVVGDTRERLGTVARPMYYAPMQQSPLDFFSVVVRSESVPQKVLSSEVGQAAAAVDPAIAAPQLKNYNELIGDASVKERSAAALLGALALVALLLALSGIFGVVSYSVTQRYREFGVRMALGALPRDVVVDVLKRSLAITAVGAGIGVFIALLGARAVESQLYEISPFDPFTFGIVLVLLFACATAAALLPALRATRVDPATALRYE